MTTGKIAIFERLAFRAKMLNYGLIFFRENEQTFRTGFDRAKSEGRHVHADNFEEFTRLYLQAVVYGELALFWGAFDAYCYQIYGRTNGFDDTRARTKEFRVKCHRGHNDGHLLTILKAVRDREIHGLPNFNVDSLDPWTCDRSSDDIMLQMIRVREFDDRREVLLFGGMTKEEQAAIQEFPSSERYTEIAYETLGEFLVEEAIECVRAFDIVTSSTGSWFKDKKAPTRKPLAFLQ